MERAKEKARMERAKEKVEKASGGKGYNYNYGYRPPGKGVGKGLNELSDDWYNAWGNNGWGDYEDEYDYSEDHWNSYGGEIGNVAMMVERGEKSV